MRDTHTQTPKESETEADSRPKSHSHSWQNSKCLFTSWYRLWKIMVWSPACVRVFSFSYLIQKSKEIVIIMICVSWFAWCVSFAPFFIFIVVKRWTKISCRVENVNLKTNTHTYTYAAFLVSNSSAQFSIFSPIYPMVLCIVLEAYIQAVRTPRWIECEKGSLLMIYKWRDAHWSN